MVGGKKVFFFFSFKEFAYLFCVMNFGIQIVKLLVTCKKKKKRARGVVGGVGGATF